MVKNDMGTNKAIVLGTQKIQTHKSGKVLHILCESCGRTSPVLVRELPEILKKNQLSLDTEISNLFLVDCPQCKPGEEHKIVSKTGDE